MLFKGKIFKVVRKKARKNGKTNVLFDCVEHSDAVAVVPIAGDGRILLVSQFRPCIGRTIWEIPAGLVESRESAPAACRRELKEETGYSVRKISHLCDIFTSPGFTDEKIHIYAARGLKPGKPSPDPEEKIKARFFSRTEISGLLDCGKITDAKTGFALLTVLRLKY